MSDIPVVTVAKILEGALEGDLFKVKSYTELAIKNLEEEGEERSARILRSRLDGTYKNSPKVTLDDKLEK